MRPLKSNLTRQALSGWQQGVTPADNQRLNTDGKECLKALGIVGNPPNQLREQSAHYHTTLCLLTGIGKSFPLSRQRSMSSITASGISVSPFEGSLGTTMASLPAAGQPLHSTRLRGRFQRFVASCTSMRSVSRHPRPAASVLHHSRRNGSHMRTLAVK